MSDFNTAYGESALGSNGTGCCNTAIGEDALVSNIDGNWNTALGTNALIILPTGFNNTALGSGAGANLTSGDSNIYISNQGVATESNTIRIGDIQTATFVAGISGTAVVGDAVVVDANGQLGTVASAARFKKEIRPMDKTSEAILALKPVSFQYKSDSKGTPQFGLIADEVAKVNPDLVVRDRKGEIYSIRYEAVNAMLLNEFLKEHGTVQVLKSTVAKQEARIAQQQKGMEAVTARLDEQQAQIQKVSAWLEVSKPAPQMVVNHQ